MRRRGVIAMLGAFTAVLTKGQSFVGSSASLNLELRMQENQTLSVVVPITDPETGKTENRKVTLSGREIIEALQPPFQGAI